MKGLYATLLIALQFFLFILTANAQVSSCFSLRVGQVSGQPGDIVSVPVQAAGTLDDLISAQFALTWDPADLQYAVPQLDFGANPLSLSSQFFNVNQQGSLRFAWFDLFLTGIPVQPGDTLFMVNFEIQPGASGFIPIVLNNNYPGIPLEIGGLIDGIVPTGALDGGVWVGSGNANPLIIEEVCQNAADCSAPYGSINLTLDGGTPPYVYSWIGPSGPIPGSENLSAAGAGQYSVTITDQNGATASGAFTLESDVTFLSIFPNEIEQPTCQGNDGMIEVEAVNGTPPYIYAWSNAGLGPVQSGLGPGVYSVTVTDAGGCTSDATFALHEISGFSLHSSIQQPHCGQNDGGLIMTPAGFSPPFQFLWNNGSTSSQIGNLGAGVYSVTVTNAEGCAESKTIWLETDGPNQGWAHNETFDCDTMSGLVDLAGVYWNTPGASLPIHLTWGNGSTQTIDSLSDGAFVYGLSQQPQGAQYVQVADSSGCTTFAFFQAVCTEGQSNPVTSSCLTLQSGEAAHYSIYSSKECVPITVTGFDDISSLRFGLDWPEDKYVFTNLREVQLTPFTPFDLNVFQDQGALLIDWQNPFGQGVTLPDGDTLLSVCFYNIAIPEFNSGLAFSDDFSPKAVQAGGQEIGFVAFDGRFYSQINTPASACTISPDCLNDGEGGFYLDGVWWNPNDPIKLFQHDVQQWTGTTEELTTLTPGTYRAEFPAPFSPNPQLGLFHLPVLTTSDCVWPGDADNNAAANHHDLLYLGLAYGASGPARAAQALDWSGQSGETWSQRTALRKVDYKNMDTNGDGLISLADTLAIVQNWGQVINPATDNPYDAPLGNQVLPFAPTLTMAPDTAVAGQLVSIPVILGSPAVQADSMHGLAFSVVYDPAMLQNNVYFQPAASWLGNPASDLIWLQRNFPAQGRIDVAITRFDGQPVNGDGVIGHLYVIIEDDIFFVKPDEGPDWAPDLDTLKFTPLHFGNLQAIGPDEQPIALIPVDVNLPIRRQGASGVSTPQAWASDITVWPNPLVVPATRRVVVARFPPVPRQRSACALVGSTGWAGAPFGRVLGEGVYGTRHRRSKGGDCRKKLS